MAVEVMTSEAEEEEEAVAVGEIDMACLAGGDSCNSLCKWEGVVPVPCAREEGLRGKDDALVAKRAKRFWMQRSIAPEEGEVTVALLCLGGDIRAMKRLLLVTGGTG